jgi:predicted enzyme related to lactoylglutathione lyase
MVDSRAERWFIAPYFFVPDVVAAAHHYRDTLGFSFDRFWGEPASFCMVKRGGVIIMLAQIDDGAMVRPNSLADREGGAWDAYTWVPDADALHAELVAKGATIARGLCDQEYGCRDFDVLDCNGYRLCFGQDIM